MDKVANILSVALFLRIFLPGTIGTLLFFPILRPIATVAIYWGNYPSLSATVLGGGLLIGIGLGVVLCDHFIYRTYEGYFIPRGLRERLTECLNQKIDKKLKEAAFFKAAGKSLDYNVTWEWLGKFVIDEETTGDVRPRAVLPTMFGNILSQYEDYPQSRYGMDGVFYWPRLWLVIDEQIRKDIESTWAWGDSLLYISAVSCLAGIVNLAAFLLHLFNLPTKILLALSLTLPKAALGELPSSYLFLGLTAISFIIGWITYRMSLPVHYRIGEQFKAVYDLYREKLRPITDADRFPVKLREERIYWEKTRRFLDFLKKE